jgi:Lon protease-like protein
VRLTLYPVFVSDTRIPLFPLSTIAVPGAPMPLHIFEPRYRQLVSDLLAGSEEARSFGIIAIREGHEVGVGAVTALHHIGTEVRLEQAERYPDGRYDVLTVGARRFRLDAVHDHRPYAVASITWLDECAGPHPAELVPAVREHLMRYRHGLANLGVIDNLTDDDLALSPRELSYQIATSMLLDRSDRQSVLEAGDDTERLRLGLTLLRRECALVEELGLLPAGDLAPTGISLN